MSDKKHNGTVEVLARALADLHDEAMQDLYSRIKADLAAMEDRLDKRIAEHHRVEHKR